MFFAMKRCRRGRKQNVAAVISSLGVAIGVMAAALAKSSLDDGEASQGFPWLLVGIGVGVLALVGLAVLVKWRSREEQGGGDEEDRPCSR